MSNNEKELLDKYDFSKGQRGKYSDSFAEGSNVIVLDPDIAKRYKDSAAVNKALRELIKKTG